jgi:UDP-glucose 4-epimerase
MELNGLKILVTGGAGFIGSHLVDALLKEGNKVIVYDNLDEYYSGKEENIRHNLVNRNMAFVKADIQNSEALLKATTGVDVIFHLAAQPGVRYSMDNPIKTHNVNTLGTLNVLRAARQLGVKRVIYASSSSVYGNPTRLPVDEQDPTNPISIYGVSKLTAEIYCKVFYQQFDLPIVALRYFTVYGPRQRPDMAIYTWTKAILEGRPVTVYGDGNQTRDFTYVDDIVEGTCEAAQGEGVEGQVFNLGGGCRISVNETVKMLADLSGVSRSRIIHDRSKPGDVRHTHADIAKARKMLDFDPKVQVEYGLGKFVAWYSGKVATRTSS